MARWVRRRQGEDALPVTLARRRLYILPTRAGVAFAALLFLMLLAGLNYANSLALFLTFLLAAFALVVMQQCHRNLLGVSVRRGCARRGVRRPPGRAARGAGQRGRRRAWRSRPPSTTPPVVTGAAAGHARLRLQLPLPPHARGLVRIERVRISTAHPFGLFRAWTWVHAPLELLVYPAPGRPAAPAGAGCAAHRRARPQRHRTSTSGSGCARSATATRRARSTGRPTRARRRCW